MRGTINNANSAGAALAQAKARPMGGMGAVSAAELGKATAKMATFKPPQKSAKSGFIDSVLGAKSKAEQKLQGFGRRIRKNIDQGQADLKSGKIGRNDYINPFK